MANLVHRNDPTTMQPFGNQDPFRMMRDMLRFDPFRGLGSFPTLDGPGFAPSFDVKETKDSLVIQADLPGMTEKDLGISVTGNRLTIAGERKAEEQKEEENYYMFERTYGSFNRTFALPEEVEVDKVQAELKDGVLRLTLPKKLAAQPKKIQVKTGK